jgi:cytochrome P450
MGSGEVSSRADPHRGHARLHLIATGTRLLRPKRFAGARAPGPRGREAFKLVRNSFRDPAGTYIQSFERYGDISRVELRGAGHVVSHFVAHPDYVQHVLQDNQHNYRKAWTYLPLRAFLGDGLLTSDGDLWLRHRRMLQPAFHRRVLDSFGTAMLQACNALRDRWESRKEQEPLDMGTEMARLTLDIVGRALFGADLREYAHRVSPAVASLQELALRAFSLPYIWPFAARPERIPIRRYREAVKDLNQIVYELIHSRREEDSDRSDILGILIRARDEDSGTPLTDAEIRDELMTFVLAGHETTANALTWTFYLLGQNDDHLRHLKDELDAVLGGRDPSPEDVGRLPYTQAIIEEAMRLYPPAWSIDREALEEDEIGGYSIPAMSTVFTSPYATHRHPDFWPEPERFDPERFLGSSDRHRFAYFPFGGGRRQCIGKAFALMEATIALAVIAQRFQVEPVTTDPIGPRAEVTLRPQSPILMHVRRRNSSGPGDRGLPRNDHERKD